MDNSPLDAPGARRAVARAPAELKLRARSLPVAGTPFRLDGWPKNMAAQVRMAFSRDHARTPQRTHRHGGDFGCCRHGRRCVRRQHAGDAALRDLRTAGGFSRITLTLIYAAYVIGNLAALLSFGGRSDRIGWRQTRFTSHNSGDHQRPRFVRRQCRCVVCRPHS